MMMSHNSWKASLHQLLNQQTAESRIAIVGIGNTLRSDDAAGIVVARALKKTCLFPDRKPILIMDAGHAPENGTGELRSFAPDTVLLIDAVEMGEAPGTIRWVEMEEIEGMSASTHSLPLSMLASYLNWELKCDVNLLGIQPKTNDVGETVTPEVLHAVHHVTEQLVESISLRCGVPAVANPAAYS
jgi:hydrogenase 3 maturation protease